MRRALSFHSATIALEDAYLFLMRYCFPGVCWNSRNHCTRIFPLRLLSFAALIHFLAVQTGFIEDFSLRFEFDAAVKYPGKFESGVFFASRDGTRI